MPVRIPANCSSITFTASGVRTPTARIISGLTASEETALVYNTLGVNRIVSTNASTGAAEISIAPIMSSITINGNVLSVTAGRISAVNAADATAFLGATINQPFELVSGV